MRISDWSSDVCSSDLAIEDGARRLVVIDLIVHAAERDENVEVGAAEVQRALVVGQGERGLLLGEVGVAALLQRGRPLHGGQFLKRQARVQPRHRDAVEVHRSEEHTSELQSLMRISYAVFCLK